MGRLAGAAAGPAIHSQGGCMVRMAHAYLKRRESVQGETYAEDAEAGKARP